MSEMISGAGRRLGDPTGRAAEHDSDRYHEGHYDTEKMEGSWRKGAGYLYNTYSNPNGSMQHVIAAAERVNLDDEDALVKFQEQHLPDHDLGLAKAFVALTQSQPSLH